PPPRPPWTATWPTATTRWPANPPGRSPRQPTLPAEGRSGNSRGFPMVERQALDQQQGRAQVAEPGQQPEQRRLVGQRAGQFRRAVIGVGDGKAVEPGRPGWVEVSANADAIAGRRLRWRAHGVLPSGLPRSLRSGNAG